MNLDTIIYSVCGAVGTYCLIRIAVVVLPKFPQLALIDTGIIPAEREARKKKEIMHGRTHRILAGAVGSTGKALLPLWVQIRDAFRVKYRDLLNVQRQFKREKELTPAETRERIVSALADAAKLSEVGKNDEAEKKYMEALGYDPRRVEAYRGLADIYMDDRRYDRAKETLQYLIKALIRENRCIHGAGRRSFATAAEENPNACPASPAAHAEIAARSVALATAFTELRDAEGNMGAYELAVNMEPTNPRYLDLLLEACILGGDKRRAEEVLAAFRESNPGNAKLAEFDERVAGMAEQAESRRRKRK
jgi:tetratricopeptide (TPR) repeat protein